LYFAASSPIPVFQPVDGSYQNKPGNVNAQTYLNLRHFGVFTLTLPRPAGKFGNVAEWACANRKRLCESFGDETEFVTGDGF